MTESIKKTAIKLLIAVFAIQTQAGVVVCEKHYEGINIELASHSQCNHNHDAGDDFGLEQSQAHCAPCSDTPAFYSAQPQIQSKRVQLLLAYCPHITQQLSKYEYISPACANTGKQTLQNITCIKLII